jgi:subtilisin-like proprotein convertase family protein
VGLIAIPSLLKDLDATGVSSELAITNVVPKPGFTDFAIFIYDQNGLLDYVCEKLNEKQVEYINLQSWGYINNGFKGSAIISAVFWEHEVFDDTGFFIRNLVGLGAVIVERSGTRLGEEIAGDEAAGARGIPFRQQDLDGDGNLEEGDFRFRFQGPLPPACPGVDIPRPDPGQCPDELTVSCTDCPVPILDVSTVTSSLAVQNLPPSCRIADVDVFLDIQHTWNSDLDVFLLGPGGQVPLFQDICGATDNILTTLSDEAPQPIGAVCPPIGGTFDTQPPDGLLLFEGQSPSATWRLIVTDDVGGDVGTIRNWSLIFTFE